MLFLEFQTIYPHFLGNKEILGQFTPIQQKSREMWITTFLTFSSFFSPSWRGFTFFIADFAIKNAQNVNFLHCRFCYPNTPHFRLSWKSMYGLIKKKTFLSEPSEHKRCVCKCTCMYVWVHGRNIWTPQAHLFLGRRGNPQL